MENVAQQKSGKKYLLYIHRPEFAEEEHKSGLVNILLDEHYDGPRYPTSIDNPTNPTPQATIKRPIVTGRNKDMESCKHGVVKGFCKKGCK